MYILSIIPLTKIPLPSSQILDYFSQEDVLVGGIVEIKLGRRLMLGIVVASSSVRQQKHIIKASSFRLRPIESAINSNEIIPKNHLKLILWSSRYFYSPIGLIAKSFLPAIFSKPTKKFIKELKILKSPVPKPLIHQNIAPKKPILLFEPNISRIIENYNDAVSEHINKKNGVLFLVSDLYKIDYFQQKVRSLKDAVILHGAISPSKEYKIWQDVRNGKILCIVGTRSALSIPIYNLGLVVVDAEESPFYKSFDQQPYINAKDVAIKLGEINNSQVILGTGLPSAESCQKIKSKAYLIKKIKHTGPDTTLRPEHSKIEIIDMRKELKEKNYSIFSRNLQDNLLKTIRENQQAILFINRKGLSTGLLCRDCGHITKCPKCDIPFVYHESKNNRRPFLLLCHHCGTRQVPPSACPNCQGLRIKFIGTGTQRVEQELTKLFPDCSYEILTLDSAPSWKHQEKIFESFRDKKVNILIGTQLMLKKELLTRTSLASIITIDPLMAIPDFRMGERIFSTIHILANVADRLLIQTYNPDSEIVSSVLSSGRLDHATWIEQELDNREALSFPPFSQIIKLTYSHPNPQKSEQEANLMKDKLQVQAKNHKLKSTNYRLLGPAPSYIPRINNRYIWHIVIKSKIEDLVLRNKLLSITPSDWKIDVDPVDML